MEMQIKITMRYHSTSIKIAIIRKEKNQRGCGKWEPLSTVGGNVKWYGHYEKQYGRFSKKDEYHMISPISGT